MESDNPEQMVEIGKSCGKTALVLGGGGQDGTYLSELLLKKGYEVIVGTRDASAPFPNLVLRGISEHVSYREIKYESFRSMSDVLTDVQPDELYNLSGQSSVGMSFEQPAETYGSIVLPVQNILEFKRKSGKEFRIYNAGSSEVFGNSDAGKMDEDTAIAPVSPYGVAKAAAMSLVRLYRQAYGQFACTGLLFNHESPLRPEHYVTKKIARGAAEISVGMRHKLKLGNLEVCRDWGYAPEYVDAMWRMLNASEPADLVIGTGESVFLKDLVFWAFDEVGLDWKGLVEVETGLKRQHDILLSTSNPKKAQEIIGWEAKTRANDMIRIMVRHEVEKLKEKAEGRN